MVDWAGAASAGTAVNPVEAMQKGSAFGYDMGQKLATVHALQGIDLANPSNALPTINALMKSGAFDAANAVLSLNMRRMGIEAGQRASAAMMGAGQPTQDAETQDQTADPQMIAKNQAVTVFARDAANELQAVPVAERAAYVQNELIPRAAQVGIPAQMVQSIAGSLDITDDAKLKQFADHQDQWLSHAATGGQDTGAGPGLHPAVAAYAQGLQLPQNAPSSGAPGSLGWAMDLLKNRGAVNDIIMGKAYGGPDLTPALENARAIAMPEIAKQAELQYAPAIAAGTEAAKQATEIAFAPQQIAIAAQTAGAVASADQAARAPYEFETVQGPNGQPVYVRKDFALGYSAAHGGVLSQGIAPAEQAFQTGQAGQAAEILKPNPQDLATAKDTQANAERALSILTTLKTDATTPWKVAAANALRVAGVPGAEQYAADAAGYQAITTQALASGAHAVFPARTTNTDLHLMEKVFPALTTPHDQAATALGTQAAQALRTQDWEAFKASYEGEHKSPDAIYKAWLAGPGGQSIFQSREWANIPIGGRPAFNPATDVKTVKGVKVGAWGIGTGHPVYFVVH